MPSTSEAQARLMAAAAHTPGGFGGVPQSVGREFNQADKGSALLSNAMRHRPHEGFGGSIGKVGSFHQPHFGGGAGGGSGGGLGHGIPQIAKPESMSMASPWYERSEAHQINTPFHGGIGRGHFAMGGVMSSSMADPYWTRAEARQINDVPFRGSGLIPGSGFGRTDRIPLAVGAESHIIPADAVSAPGQGSTEAGARAWLAAIKSGPFGVPPPQRVGGHGPPGAPRAPSFGSSSATGMAEGGRGTTSILAASGELVVAPEDVEAIGQRGIRDGRAKRGESALECGHRLLDEAIKHIRDWHQKWLKTAPPPKK